MIQDLKELVGRRFLYKSKEILIKNIKKVSGVYVVLTDIKTYNFFESEVPFFLKDIVEIPRVKLKEGVLEKRQLELKNVSIQEKKQELNTNKMEDNEKNIVLIQKETSLVIEEFDVRSVLVETIEKVRTDKSYIPQANAICNVVSQMINIQKLELSIKNKK
jgi:hypothetical protein